MVGMEGGFKEEWVWPRPGRERQRVRASYPQIRSNKLPLLKPTPVVLPENLAVCCALRLYCVFCVGGGCEMASFCSRCLKSS